jgi:GNAT superfamily N-acetyltransferase
MNIPPIELCDERECERLGAFLVERIYEFNAQATSFFDGRLIGARLRSDAGEIIAAANGHTWGGSCVIDHLWVHALHRSRGLGRLLLQAIEAEASLRDCEQVMLSTHSFQAPAFYERLGYERRAVIHGQPKGYASIVYVKQLEPA